MALHLCNLKRPNSKFNTHLIALANVPDTTNNIQRIMDDLKTQMDELGAMTWHDKVIKVFVFGDYWFLSKLFGISGPAGTHPCLWCHTTTVDMQEQTNVLAQERKH